MIWPDMIWVYILVYDVWNFAYTYNCLPTFLVLRRCTSACTDNRSTALEQRRLDLGANTLCIWCMFAQVFPLFQDILTEIAGIPMGNHSKTVC